MATALCVGAGFLFGGFVLKRKPHWRNPLIVGIPIFIAVLVTAHHYGLI